MFSGVPLPGGKSGRHDSQAITLPPPNARRPGPADAGGLLLGPPPSNSAARQQQGRPTATAASDALDMPDVEFQVPILGADIIAETFSEGNKVEPIAPPLPNGAVDFGQRSYGSPHMGNEPPSLPPFGAGGLPPPQRPGFPGVGGRPGSERPGGELRPPHAAPPPGHYGGDQVPPPHERGFQGPNMRGRGGGGGEWADRNQYDRNEEFFPARPPRGEFGAERGRTTNPFSWQRADYRGGEGRRQFDDDQRHFPHDPMHNPYVYRRREEPDHHHDPRQMGGGGGGGGGEHRRGSQDRRPDWSDHQRLWTPGADGGGGGGGGRRSSQSGGPPESDVPEDFDDRFRGDYRGGSGGDRSAAQPGGGGQPPQYERQQYEDGGRQGGPPPPSRPYEASRGLEGDGYHNEEKFHRGPLPPRGGQFVPERSGSHLGGDAGRPVPFQQQQQERQLPPQSDMRGAIDSRQQALDPRQQAMDPRQQAMDLRQQTLDARQDVRQPLDSRQSMDPRHQQGLDPRQQGGGDLRQGGGDPRPAMDLRQPPGDLRQPPIDLRVGGMDPRQQQGVVDLRQTLDLRQQSIDPRQQGMDTRQQQSLDPRQQVMESRQPPMDLRQPGMEPRNPGMDPRQPGMDSRNPGMDSRNPGMDPRNPGMDPRNPGMDPRNPGMDSRNPAMDPRQQPLDMRQQGPRGQLPQHDYPLERKGPPLPMHPEGGGGGFGRVPMHPDEGILPPRLPMRAEEGSMVRPPLHPSEGPLSRVPMHPDEPLPPHHEPESYPPHSFKRQEQGSDDRYFHPGGPQAPRFQGGPQDYPPEGYPPENQGPPGGQRYPPSENQVPPGGQRYPGPPGFQTGRGRGRGQGPPRGPPAPYGGPQNDIAASQDPRMNRGGAPQYPVQGRPDEGYDYPGGYGEDEDMDPQYQHDRGGPQGGGVGRRPLLQTPVPGSQQLREEGGGERRDARTRGGRDPERGSAERERGHRSPSPRDRRRPSSDRENPSKRSRKSDERDDKPKPVGGSRDLRDRERKRK